MISPWAPYPWDGGSKRIHTLCRMLGERFQFSLLTFAAENSGSHAAAADLAAEHRHLRPVFGGIHWVGKGPEPSARGLPEDVSRFYRESMRLRLADTLARGEADLVHVEYELMAPYARHIKGAIPLVWTQHDMGSLSIFNSYFREMSGFGRLRRLPDWFKRAALVRKAGSWFDRVVAMTAEDQRRLSLWMDERKVRTISTGVDVEHFSPRAGAEAAEDSLVFLGHYPHYPNEDAVLHFHRDIWPIIRARRPGLRFYAVGSSPTPAVRRLPHEDSRITVTGTVEDVRPYLQKAAVFVAPMRLGFGIKGKILEAAAAGVPVVATSRAAEGLALRAGHDFLKADGAREFAQAVLRLLEDSGLRREISLRARAAVEKRYDWKAQACLLGDLYEELLKERAGR